jgi:hypothetical protein
MVLYSHNNYEPTARHHFWIASCKRTNTFQRQMIRYYNENKTVMPWRVTVDPYCILVSEFMFQQTQEERVLLKDDPFSRCARCIAGPRIQQKGYKSERYRWENYNPILKQVPESTEEII